MKKNTLLYIIITILLIIIAVGVTYIIMDNKNEEEVLEPNDKEEDNNKEEKEEPTIEDGITLKDTYQEGNNIIQEYEIILNNKKNNLQITYTYKYEIDSLTHVINGIMKNTNLYDMYLRDNINNKNYTKEELFNITKLNDEFNETNFKIIKETDNKSYLLIQTEQEELFDTSELYVYNDELELISKNVISIEESPDTIAHDGFIIDEFAGNIPCEYQGSSPLYERTFKKVSEDIEDNQYVKIVENKIYFLFPKLNKDLDGGILEERIYTIHNNKLEYTVNNTYKFNGVCQQI